MLLTSQLNLAYLSTVLKNYLSQEKLAESSRLLDPFHFALSELNLLLETFALTTAKELCLL